jgi:electron transfer flavoprotein beta subunit
MASKKKKITSWSLDDLGMSADQVGLDHARTKIAAADRRPPRTVGQVVTDEGDGGLKLLDFLTTHKFV